MNADGSDVTVIAEDFSGKYLGVIDGTLYYYCSKYNEEGIRKIDTATGKETNLYTGMVENMIIADGRIYFNNSLENLKLYSMKIDGSDLHKENDFVGLYYLTIWNGRIYYSDSNDGGHLYSANIDGTDVVLLNDSYVDSITVADGWLEYNANNHVHLLRLETNEEYTILDNGIYSPCITEEGIVGESSMNNLYFYVLPHGTLAGNIIQPLKPEEYSVVESKIFYTDPSDGKIYMMNIDGSDLKML